LSLILKATSIFEHYIKQEGMKMAKANQIAASGDCDSCPYKRAVGNRKFKGTRIPGGPGKCVRPGGLCDSRKIDPPKM